MCFGAIVLMIMLGGLVVLFTSMFVSDYKCSRYYKKRNQLFNLPENEWIVKELNEVEERSHKNWNEEITLKKEIEKINEELNFAVKQDKEKMLDELEELKAQLKYVRKESEIISKEYTKLNKQWNDIEVKYGLHPEYYL